MPLDNRPELPAPLAHRFREGCRQIGISVSHGYDLVKEGKLKVLRVAGVTLIEHAELQRFLAAARQSPGPVTGRAAGAYKSHAIRAERRAVIQPSGSAVARRRRRPKPAAAANESVL